MSATGAELVGLGTAQGVGVEEMRAGDQPVIGTTSVYQEPGVYTLEASALLLPFAGPYLTCELHCLSRILLSSLTRQDPICITAP